MTTSRARVPAKINLSLAVGPLRDDGYHPLATVFQAVDLYDEVAAHATDEPAITVEVVSDDGTPVPGVPTDHDNLAVRAATLLRDTYGVDGGARLAVRKSIPVAGGMAGGSADAAGALLACADAWGLQVARTDLDALAAELGSDVPFCLTGGIAVGTDRGDQLSPVLARGHYHWVLALAASGLSTPEVFAELDRLTADDPLPEPTIDDDLMAALRTGDAEALGGCLRNDLQRAAISLRPELSDQLDVGRDAGALGSLVSGSGPTTMYLARDEAHAMDIAVALATAQVGADVVQVTGPAQGARLV